MIGIHDRKGSFSDRWITYCTEREIPYKRLNCLAPDVIQQCSNLDAIIWHWVHTGVGEQLLARQVIAALESMGKFVFPNIATCWHYDDKIAQKYLLEAIGAPLVPTWVFTKSDEAMEWIEHASWPKVFKLRCGAGSSNVLLVKSRTEAKALCRKSFGIGFPAVAGYFNDMTTRLRKTNNFNEFRTKLLRAPRTLFENLRSHLFMPRQRGYVYFQEFLPNNPFDVRITVIGNRAFGFSRMNRPNDFRASGSGQVNFDPTQLDLRCVQLAFNVANRLRTQSLAFDFLFNPEGKPMIGEISYTYMDWAIHACSGYWDESMSWHDGHSWPQDIILEDIFKALDK